jgi:glutamate synthase (NADPH) small chain
MINKSKIKEIMPALNPEKRIGSFNEVETGFTDESAFKEASRCLGCKARPCVSGCPVGVDIPEFIKCVVNRDLKSSYEIILKNNSFPAICGRVCPQEKQCEAKCVRGKTGEPVAIGRLERYVSDKHMEAEPKNFTENKNSANISHPLKHKIAVVGSGPSGLTCAAELLKFGFEVTVFEALHALGGVLAYGIPEFRLPKKILNYELRKLKENGAKIITNVIIGKSFSIDELFSSGFDAVYIASGAGLPRFMNIPGEGLAGVFAANEFLTRVNLMKAHEEKYDTPIIKPKHVVVVGGGNVAMDAARCAQRLGPEKVTVIYRRTENEMPARKDEILHAKEEKIEFLFLSNPVEFIGENGKVAGVRYNKMKLGSADNSGRKSVILESDEIFEINADAVIVAIGNGSNTLIRDSAPGIEFDGKGRIAVEPETTKTSAPYIYAGGDVVTGAATVILAMGAGKKAARQIKSDLEAKHLLGG